MLVLRAMMNEVRFFIISSEAVDFCACMFHFYICEEIAVYGPVIGEKTFITNSIIIFAGGESVCFASTVQVWEEERNVFVTWAHT